MAPIIPSVLYGCASHHASELLLPLALPSFHYRPVHMTSPLATAPRQIELVHRLVNPSISTLLCGGLQASSSLVSTQAILPSPPPNRVFVAISTLISVWVCTLSSSHTNNILGTAHNTLTMMRFSFGSVLLLETRHIHIYIAN
jgi:hypothetical protein